MREDLLNRVEHGWHTSLDTPARVVAILVAAFVVRWVIHRAISRATNAMKTRVAARNGDLNSIGWRASGLDDERARQRATTLASLLRSITTVVITVVAILTIAAQLGIELAPLLASAGVAGVALGIGAQSLVKDFLSGIFMIFEDQYGVGDLIDTGETAGTVEEVSLRITRLRDPSGVVWYIRNGEIARVANKSQGWATALVDIPVAYDSSISAVTEVLEGVVADFYDDGDWHDVLTEAPTVAGVEAVTNGAITFRIIAKCAATSQFPVSRELRARALRALEQAEVKPAPWLPLNPVNLKG